MKTNKPIFIKGILGILFAIALALFVFFRASKDKFSFQKVSGIITSLDKTNENFPNKDSLKFRYLKIDNSPKTFELFIGKDLGDFKPEFEKIDNLISGDSVTIYFDENYKTQDDPINRLTYFIDRGQSVIFIKGSGEKYLAYFLIGLSITGILTLIILKKKGKII